MPEVNAASDNIRSQYLGQDRSVNIQKEIKERSQIEDGKLGGVEFRDKPKQMDRDDFLKLLVKQLTTQDPTAPVQDQQFKTQLVAVKPSSGILLQHKTQQRRDTTNHRSKSIVSLGLAE